MFVIFEVLSHTVNPKDIFYPKICLKLGKQLTASKIMNEVVTVHIARNLIINCL